MIRYSEADNILFLTWVSIVPYCRLSVGRMYGSLLIFSTVLFTADITSSVFEVGALLTISEM